jgi:hypothetical protein
MVSSAGKRKHNEEMIRLDNKIGGFGDPVKPPTQEGHSLLRPNCRYACDGEGREEITSQS